MNHNCSFCEHKSAAALKLSEQELATQSANCLTVRFKKNDNIIRQGTYSTNVAYLKSGLVKIHIEGPYHTQVVRIVKPRNYLGLPTTFGDKINQYSVSAIEESEVCFIDIAVFRELLGRNPAFSNQILVELCRSELESYQKCVNRTQKQVRGKIADVLLDFSENIYHSDSFQLLITQEDIGNLVDATRESVSRFWVELIKDGVIGSDGKQVTIINKEALRNMSRLG